MAEEMKTGPTPEEKEMAYTLEQAHQRAERCHQIIREAFEMRNFVEAGHFKFLNERVLKKLEWNNFRALGDSNFNPGNRDLVDQTCAMLRVFNTIRLEVENQIRAGDEAREELKGYSTLLTEGEL